MQAMAIQKGLGQFEHLHAPVEEPNANGDIVMVCAVCETDFPCERYMNFMVIQALASLTAMIPTGNMADVLKRFSGSNR